MNNVLSNKVDWQSATIMDNIGVELYADILSDIRKAAKNKKWLMCSYPIASPHGPATLDVKTFGKWAQFVRVGRFRDGIPEQKNWADFEAKFLELLATLLLTHEKYGE